MKETLNYLFESNTLNRVQAKDILQNIAAGQYNSNQVSAFLAVFRMRSVTVEEMEGFRDGMLELCLNIDFPGYDLIDLCGTGGDNKDTFNISTLASFVVAGTGIKVAKHGNYGVSSFCGSSNVLEYMGVKFSNEKGALQKQLDTAGICILHAPLFHPALKQVAGIRKELAFKTFFNMLGPMVNPTKPSHQLVGVFSLELARIYSYMLQNSDTTFSIVHSLDGYDEVSLTSAFKMIERNKEAIIEPEKLGFKKLTHAEVAGGTTIPDAAAIFMNVLNNKATMAQTQVVLTNAALAIKCSKADKSFEECYAMAEESLKSSRALKAFSTIVAN